MSYELRTSKGSSREWGEMKQEKEDVLYIYFYLGCMAWWSLAGAIRATHNLDVFLYLSIG